MLKKRLKFIGIILLIILSPFSLFLQTEEQNVGLLLGLRYVNEKNITEYHTIYITEQDSSIEVKGNIKGLFVPKDDGSFQRVGINSIQYGEFVRDVIWSSNENMSTSYDVEINQEMDIYTDCEGSEIKTILFANKNYLSIELSTGGYCMGAAHPWAYDELYVLPVEHLSRDKISINNAFEKNAYSKMLDGAKKLRKRLNKQTQEALVKEPINTNWGLIRRRGQWVLRGRLGYFTEVNRGMFKDFDIEIDPAKKLKIYDKLFPTWGKIKLIEPNAIDTFTSPNKRILAIMTRNDLLVYRIDENGEVLDENPAFKMKLNKFESAVMIEWAIGKSVEKWLEDVEIYSFNFDK